MQKGHLGWGRGAHGKPPPLRRKALGLPLQAFIPYSGKPTRAGTGFAFRDEPTQSKKSLGSSFSYKSKYSQQGGSDAETAHSFSDDITRHAEPTSWNEMVL